MTEWFRRKSDKIKTFDKRDTERGQWQKCPSCSEVLYSKSLESNNFICNICRYHFRISSKDYFKLLFDTEDNIEIGEEINSIDHLDSLQTTSAEIERVLKPGGLIRIHYHSHQPKKCEPISINDDCFKKAFNWCKEIKKINMSQTSYSNNLPNNEHYALWSNFYRNHINGLS